MNDVTVSFSGLSAADASALIAFREDLRLRTGNKTARAPQTVAAPPQTAPAQSAPQAVPASPQAATAVDNYGVPYHADLHQPGKIKADGSWHPRKGQKEAADAWAAEHANAAAQPQAGFPGFAQQQQAGFPGFAPQAPVVDYAEFSRLSNALMNVGRLTVDMAMRMCSEAGIINPAELATNDIARSAIYAKLAAL